MSIENIYRAISCPLRALSKENTERLHNKLLNIALESGGKSAERICDQLSIPVSDTTLLRIIEKTELPSNNSVIALGVDDWASITDTGGPLCSDICTSTGLMVLNLIAHPL